MSADIVQRTLAGEETDAQARVRPATMVHCSECDTYVLRRRRFDHRHDLSDAPDAPTLREQRERERKIGHIEDAVPDDALFDTETWEITFHYEVVERVRVEAYDKADAKTQARELQTYDGELEHTIHTDRRRVGSASQASVAYLERQGLLPDDHDVTDDDIQTLLEYRGDGQ